MSSKWKTVRVFISSTFRDMQAERDWLVKRVFPALRQRLEPHLIHLVDIDLRWGITKEQADNDQVLGLCLQQIDECRPLFLGILGKRYGWVPSKFQAEVGSRYGWTQSHTSKSVTELEILHGVLNDPAMHGRALFCFRDNSFLHDIREKEKRRAYIEVPSRDDLKELGWREAKRRFTRYRSQLKELKKRILSISPPISLFDGYPCQWNQTLLDPVSQKTGRLDGLKEFGDWVIEKLEHAIFKAPELQEHLAAARSSTWNELSEERYFHEQFMERRTRVYVRRKELRNLLVDYVKDNKGKVGLVIGPSGSGKSALLARFVKIWKRARNKEIVITHFIGASPRSTNLYEVLRHLCMELKDTLRLEDELKLDLRELSVQFREFLNKVPADRRVVLVVDAINQLDGIDNAHSLYWLPVQIPPQVRLVVSCTDDSGQKEEAQQALFVMRNRMPYLINVGDLNHNERLLIIRKIPSVAAKTLDQSQIRLLLNNEATRNPLFLLVTLEELRGFGSFEELNRKISGLPQTGDTLTAIFQQVIQRLGEDFSSNTVKDVLTLLACSRRGLSERELLDLIEGKIARIEDSNGDLFPILRQLRPYLQYRGPLLDFFHSHLSKATHEDFFKENKNQRPATHRRLADYFQNQNYFLESLEEQRARMKRLPPTPRPANERKVDELPWQRLAEAKLKNEWEDVEQLFTDPVFLESKAEAGMVFDLAFDFMQTVKTLPVACRQYRIIRLLEEALLHNLHFIARHPTTLFQCMWNFCWWHDCPEMAKHSEASTDKLQTPYSPNQHGFQAYVLLEQWRRVKSASFPGFPWIRSLRPAPNSSGAICTAVLRGHTCPVQYVIYDSQFHRLASCSAHLVPKLIVSLNSVWHNGKCVPVVAPTKHLYSSIDNTLRIWDAETGQALSIFNSPDGPLSACAFSPDGQVIACCGSPSGTVRIVETDTGNEIACYYGHTSKVCRVAFSPDGSLIASASTDGTVRVREARTGSDLQCLRGQQSSWHCLAFSPRGELLATGSHSNENSLCIWDIASGKLVANANLHDGIAEVSFSPDGHNIVVACFDHRVVLFTLDGGILREQPIGTHECEVLGVAFDRSGLRVVSGSIDRTVRVWDVHRGTEALQLRGHVDIVNSVAFSPDGRFVVSGSADCTVRIWDTARERRTVPVRLRDHMQDITDIAFAADGSQVLSISLDGTLRVWDSAGIQLQVRPESERVRKILASVDGQKVVAGDLYGIRIHDLTRKTTISLGPRKSQIHAEPDTWTLSSCGWTNAEITDFVVTADGKQVIAGCWNGDLRVWSVDDGRELEFLKSSAEIPEGLAFSPGENRIIYTQEVTCIVASHDGMCIACGHADGTVRLWDRVTMKGKGHCRHRSAVRSIALSPELACIASGSADGEIVVWLISPTDSASSPVFRQFQIGMVPVTQLAFTTDGQWLIALCAELTLRVNPVTGATDSMPGLSDTLAIATDLSRPKPQAIVHARETCFSVPFDSVVMAWFPIPLTCLRTAPNGNLWAGADVNHLCVLVLEGGTEPVDNTNSLATEKLSNRGTHLRSGRNHSFEIPRETVPNSIIPSPNATCAAYVVRGGNVGMHVEINGVAQCQYDAVSGLTFSMDSRLVAYVARRNHAWFVVFGEKEMETYADIGKTSPVVSPDSQHVAYTACLARGSWVAVLDGAVIGGPYEGFSPGGLLFSPDSKRIAYVIKDGNAWTVVVDRHKRWTHMNILQMSLTFSPDSKQLAYIACEKEKAFLRRERTVAMLVVNGVKNTAWLHDESSDRHGVSNEIVFSPDSQRIAYCVTRDGQSTWIMDGAPQVWVNGLVSGWRANPDWRHFPDYGKVSCRPRTLSFSPNSQHFAYAGNDRGQHLLIYDGKPHGLHAGILNMPIIFSPDSLQVAYGAEEDGEQFIVLAGQPLRRHYGLCGDYVFSPDSTQCAYVAIESSGTFQFVVGSRQWQMPGGPMIGGRLIWDNADTLHTLITNERRITIVSYRIR